VDSSSNWAYGISHFNGAGSRAATAAATRPTKIVWCLPGRRRMPGLAESASLPLAIEACQIGTYPEHFRHATAGPGKVSKLRAGSKNWLQAQAA